MNKSTYASLLLAALSLGFIGTAHAQVRPLGDINLIVGFPQGQFHEHVDNVGVGLNFTGGLALGRSPVIVGAEVGFLIYGFERRNEPFSTAIPDVTVDVETSNFIVPVHLLLRMQPPSGTVQPYFDALFGFNYFATETSIKNDRFFDDEPIASSTNFDDAALSYGVGGGLDFRVYRGRGRRGSLFINVGARYLFGGEAEYLKKGSIERRDGQVFFNTERSETNMLVTNLGLTFRF